MRLAAVILGVFGCAIGLLDASVLVGVGGHGALFAAPGGHGISWLAVAAFLGVALALVGAALAMSRPKMAWILLLVAAAWSVGSTSAFMTPAALVMLVAAAFAFVAARASRRSVTAPAGPSS